MRKLILLSLVLVAFSARPTLATAAVKTAVVQDDTFVEDSPSNTSAEGDLDSGLVDEELGATDEEAPAPEYPYPGAKEEGIVAAPVEPAAPPVNLALERPVKIDEDTGDYQYSREVVKPTPLSRGGDRTPESTTESGQYEFSTDVKSPTFSQRAGVEAPQQISTTGEFRYSTEHSDVSATAAFRVGFFGPPALKNDKTGTTFQDIYTRDQLPVLFADYEWPLSKKLGHIGIKFGSGLFLAQGKGVFVKPDYANRRPDDIPTEQYTFFMFPNQLTAQYRFQYSENQAIVPYVEGGAGYFTFVEFRDDSSSPKIGGSLQTVFAGGVNFLMDWLDPDAVMRLDQDYGINHVYLTTEFRQILSVNKAYDFTSSVINAGFLLQF